MTNNAGDLFDEAAGTQVKTVAGGVYQFVDPLYTLVVLQDFTVLDAGELDLEGELVVLA